MHVSDVRWGLNWLTLKIPSVALKPLQAIEMNIGSFCAGGLAAPPDRAVTSRVTDSMKCSPPFISTWDAILFIFTESPTVCEKVISRLRDACKMCLVVKRDTRQAPKTHAWTRSLPCPPAHDDVNLLAFFLEPQIWHSVTSPTLKTQCLLHILNTLFLTLKTHERTSIMPPVW